MTWHRVGEMTEGHRFMTVNGRHILLVNADGRWWAVEDRCTHADCAFSTDGEIDGHIAVCNCHGSEFDIRTGDVLAAPAETSLTTFPIRQSGSRLEVQVD